MLKLDKAVETSSTHLDDETSEDLQMLVQEEDGNISSKFNEDSFQACSVFKHQRESL